MNARGGSAGLFVELGCFFSTFPVTLFTLAARYVYSLSLSGSLDRGTPSTYYYHAYICIILHDQSEQLLSSMFS
ncbi:hypothetical protein A0H81_10220 [Grifola frondosa]|uniref:Uncharacterized protein n=1 Tax=Grifola frondosa TaxID=5627 RepID=A0A1C7LZG3_GRIFR|nr:hypothetical protein A0H81_10220 [Grifola frondosa]